MYLSQENKKIFKKITDGKTIKEKYYGIQAMNKIKQIFFPNNKKEADKLIQKWEGKKPPSLELFLEYLEMSEDEFNEIALKQIVPPFKPDLKNIKISNKTHDFDKWYREAKK